MRRDSLTIGKRHDVLVVLTKRACFYHKLCVKLIAKCLYFTVFIYSSRHHILKAFEILCVIFGELLTEIFDRIYLIVSKRDSSLVVGSHRKEIGGLCIYVVGLVYRKHL